MMEEVRSDRVVGIGLASFLDAPMDWLLPALQPAPHQDTSQLASPEFRGQWWLLGVAPASSILNYFLGEESLFRGVLLPKMQGVFGKCDWVANAVLFGFVICMNPGCSLVSS